MAYNDMKIYIMDQKKTHGKQIAFGRRSPHFSHRQKTRSPVPANTIHEPNGGSVLVFDVGPTLYKIVIQIFCVCWVEIHQER